MVGPNFSRSQLGEYNGRGLLREANFLERQGRVRVQTSKHRTQKKGIILTNDVNPLKGTNFLT